MAPPRLRPPCNRRNSNRISPWPAPFLPAPIQLICRWSSQRCGHAARAGAAEAGSATYVTSTGGVSTAYYAGATGSGTGAGAGTVMVTALTASSVQGTFSFTGISGSTGASKSVTNGTFNVGL